MTMRGNAFAICHCVRICVWVWVRVCVVLNECISHEIRQFENYDSIESNNVNRVWMVIWLVFPSSILSNVTEQLEWRAKRQQNLHSNESKRKLPKSNQQLDTAIDGFLIALHPLGVLINKTLTWFMMHVSGGVSSHCLFAFAPLCTTVLEPNLRKERKKDISTRFGLILRWFCDEFERWSEMI